MSDFPVSRASRFTLRNSVAQSLREAILDGRIAAGTHLAEIELSASFGVSRATLREALRELQQQGWLTQDSRGRVSVRRVSAEEIRNIFEVRLALESVAARRLCGLPDGTQAVALLRTRLERLKAEVSLAEDMHADLEFHGTMCQLSGNPVLYEAWRGLSGLILSTMVSGGPRPARENAAFDRHAPIVDLIEAGDAPGVEEFLVQHMATAADLLMAQLGPGEAPAQAR